MILEWLIPFKYASNDIKFHFDKIVYPIAKAWLVHWPYLLTHALKLCSTDNKQILRIPRCFFPAARNQVTRFSYKYFAG